MIIDGKNKKRKKLTPITMNLLNYSNSPISHENQPNFLAHL